MTKKKPENEKRQAGRPLGSPNKSTVEFKEAVNNLIAYATPQMVDWIAKIAQENPDKALDHVYKFAQFGYPLLARTDVQNLDKHGNPADNKIILEILDGNKTSDNQRV